MVHERYHEEGGQLYGPSYIRMKRVVFITLLGRNSGIFEDYPTVLTAALSYG